MSGFLRHGPFSGACPTYEHEFIGLESGTSAKYDSLAIDRSRFALVRAKALPYPLYLLAIEELPY